MSRKNGNYNLPRFRQISSQSVDLDSTRTVSSSSSMMSTPSNYIRRFRNQNDGKHANSLAESNSNGERKYLDQKHLQPNYKPTKGTSLVRNKLLNLKGTRKRVISDEQKDQPNKFSNGFMLARSVNDKLYDYSVFTSYPDVNNDDGSPAPCVKEAQVKAWESAEKVSKNLIFDDMSDSSDDEEIIGEIPGYTKGELSLILKRFHEKNFVDEDEERKIIWDYRQKHQANQENIYSNYSSMAGKRKAQITQKKELLRRVFGYGNNFNQEFITNNTSYSSIDNVSNTQKTFHEDKDEINHLIAEDRAFNQSLREMKDYMAHKIMSDSDDDLNYTKFQSLSHIHLTSLYSDHLNGILRAEDNDDLQSFTASFLRKKVKDADCTL